MVQLQPFEPPPVAQPSAVQQQALDAFGERVTRALARAVAGAGGQCVAPMGPVWEEELDLSAKSPWSAHARWTQGASWSLLLAEGAVRALLAALLGQDEVTAQALTALDLNLLRLPARQLAQELSREMPGRRAVGEVEMGRGTAPLGPGPVVAWRAEVRHGATAGQVALAAPWAQLAPLISPEPDDTHLRPEELAHAPVLVEATLIGPPVTARELLGMQPGDVLSLGGGDHQSVLTANGQPFARGRIGAKGTQLAVNIQHVEPARLPDSPQAAHSLSQEE